MRPFHREKISEGNQKRAAWSFIQKRKGKRKFETK